MTKYSGSTCHEIGYKWLIDAPKGLNKNDIEYLINALMEYDDKPEISYINDIVRDIEYHEGLEKDKIELYKKVTFELEVVHRNYFVNELKKDN